jgi:glutaredoxin
LTAKLQSGKIVPDGHPAIYLFTKNKNMAYQDKAEKIPGRKTKDIMIYSLSTCFWCDKVKDFLKEQGIEFNILVVDRLEGADQQAAVEEISKYNPDLSFPTTVINNGEKVIIGFNQEELIKQIS